LQDFKKLQVWQAGHALAVDVYRATADGRIWCGDALADQMRRAVVSIGANIAEGCGRATPRDFLKFLNISMASAGELESHVLLAAALGLISTEVEKHLSQQVESVRKMLVALAGAIRRANANPGRPGG
jgi:four helix bundle protein